MTSIYTSSDNSILPEEIKVLNLAIGVSENTNSNLNFNSDQYLIVGEKTQSEGDFNQNIYSFLVDEQGVAVNTSFNERAALNSTSALYVDGDIFFTGQLLGNYMSQLLGENYVTSNNTWFSVSNDSTNGIGNIYYGGNATIGNYSAATGNCNAFNIARAAKRNINNAQLSIQNLQYSQFRTAIIGNASNSPIIMNTTPGSGPIEFHMSRDQSYFATNYGTGNDTPDYSMTTVADAPHFRIDPIGNVGIHTSVNRQISYNQRVGFGDPLSPESNLVIQPMQLHVEGSVYASNIIMTDYLDQTAKHLDDIYIRRFGVTIPASQILGGQLGKGDFTFASNVYIGGSEYVNKDLTVMGSASISNSAYIGHDLNVEGTIFLRGAYLTYYSNINGINTLQSNMIQFTVASYNYSNINYLGRGISTPGIFGTGIYPDDPSDASITNQLVSRKRDPNTWELELTDKSGNGYIKQGVIGHPTQDTTLLSDGSLVFATPSSSNTAYAGVLGQLPQNIYFFPGRDPSTIPFLTRSAPPTLAIFSSHQVGINTFYPIGYQTTFNPAFSVNGDIALTGNLYINLSNQNQFPYNVSKIANFIEIDNIPSTTGGGGLFYNGILYSNVNAPYVGINTMPDQRYGLTVSGKLKSLNGYYTPDNHKFITWYDSSYLLPTGDIAPYSNISASNIFAWGNVGIGVPIPSVALSVKDNSGGNSTCIQLVKSDTASVSRIDFLGVNSNLWKIQANHSLNRFEIANDASALSNNSSIRPFMIQQKPGNIGGGIGQVYIGTNGSGLISGISQSPDPNASLTVGGNLAVMGDVNITGAFRINSMMMSNANISNIYGGVSNVNIDGQSATDIYVGGRYIQLDYNSSRDASFGRGVVIGNPFPENGSNVLISKYDKNTALRVYSAYTGMTGTNQLTPVATFQSAGSNSIIEFVALSNTAALGTISDPRNAKVSMGLFTQSSNQKYNFAILDGAYSPYMSFYNVPNSTARYIGFNSLNPTALVHITASTSEYGSNMLRLTKPIAGDNDTTSVSPSIDLQKTYTTRVPTTWSISGPNAGWNQKLSFMYTDCNVPIGTSNEIFTFTNNGCIGIGTTQPEFALDVASTGKQGSIRLWDAGNTGAPQLLFQSGSDAIFGNENIADYRMATSNGLFYFDSYTNYIRSQIFNVDQRGYIGLGSNVSSIFNTNIGGNLNIGEGIFLAGIPVASVSTGSTAGGSSLVFNAPNILMNPYNITNQYGGVAINSPTPTSNLFYIHSGQNQNMLVLDSSFPQAQIHFRTQQPNNIWNVYRMDANTSNFEWKYSPNYGAGLYFPDSNNGYFNAFSFGVSSRSYGISNSEFDTSIYGSLILNSSSPNIYFGQNTATAPYINSSNGSIILTASSNIGIGTTIPEGILSLYNSSTQSGKSNALLRIDQNGIGNMIEMYSNSIRMITVTSNGFIGVGTSKPIAPVMIVASNDIPLSSNIPSSNVPVAFAVQQLGQFGNIAHFYNYSNEGVIINDVGYVGINTLFPQSNLHVHGSFLLEGPGNFTQGVYVGQNIEIWGNAIAHGNNITDSDIRLKKDLIKIDSALDKVKTLTGYTFTNIQSGYRNTGLVAQDVQKILPEAVYTEGAHLGLAYGNIMGLIVEAIKDLSIQVDELKKRLDT
jgi:hypothetical protein